MRAGSTAYETSLLCEDDLPNELQYQEYFEYFAPGFTLHLEINPRMENANSPQYLSNIVETIDRQLKLLDGKKFHILKMKIKQCSNSAGAPSVQMHAVPDSFLRGREEVETDPDLRGLGVPQQAPCQDSADLADVQNTTKEMTDDGYTRAVVPSVQDKTRVSYEL